MRVLAEFSITEHRLHPPVIQRARKPRGEDNSPEKPSPNFSKVITPNCQAQYGAPCRCRRVAGQCIRCLADFTVSVGERATPPVQHDRGRLVGYTCLKCRSRA